jgi:D-alanyl-D-alanine dipeptidase
MDLRVYIKLLAFASASLLCAQLISCTQIKHAEPLAQPAIPTDFVVVNDLLNNVSFDIRYHGNNNFVGKPVTGYHAPLCILHKQVADALAKAATAAEQAGYRLKIFDCYRPQQAVDHFVQWTRNLSDQTTKARYYPNLNKNSLLGPYIAEKSGHSRGASLDLTLEKRSDSGQWQELDMGTLFDFFDPLSNTFNPATTQKVLNNRQLLIRFMQAGDFVNYNMEWWHFSYPDQPYPNTYFNFPVVKRIDSADY